MADSPLFIDDDDRYSRLRLIAWWDQERLKRGKVLVVGAGALGNEVLKNLALLGVGTVYVIDFDTIEESNLTRTVLFRASDCGRSKVEAAADALSHLNPDTRICPMHANVLTDVGLGLFREVDVVIGCLDNREARLWVNRSCWKVGTPWIDGGIQEINGVVKVFVPPDTPCYECAMTENDYRLINLRYSCPLLRREDILAGKVPTAPTISSIVAGLQTQEALKVMHEMPVEPGEAMVFNGLANQFYKTKYPFKEDCLSHEYYPEPEEIALSHQATAKKLFDAVRGSFESEAPLVLNLERDLVVKAVCGACSTERPIMKPMGAVGQAAAECVECGETAKPEMVHQVTEGSELAERSLSELGVPSYEIVTVSAGAEAKYCLLADDRASVVLSD